MKTLEAVFVSTLVAILVSTATVKMISKPATLSAKSESAYDRVMSTQTIRCGYVEWPPYYFKDPKGKLTGLGKETTDQILSLLDLKVEYVPVSIGNQAMDMKTGKIDSYCFDSPNVLSWLKVIDYGTPYFHGPVFVYGSTKGAKFSDIAEVNTKKTRFISFDGDLSFDLANRLFPLATKKTLPGTADVAEPFLEIESGRADYFIVDKPSYAKFSRNNPDKIQLAYEQPLAIYPVAFSVVKGEYKLLKTLNMAVEMAINMGIPARLVKKYIKDVGDGIYAVEPAQLDSHVTAQ